MTTYTDAADVGAVLSRLDRVRERAGYWLARCPAHDDNTPSLKLWRDGGRLRCWCYAGCGVRDITRAVGLPLSAWGVPDRPGWGLGFTGRGRMGSLNKLLPEREAGPREESKVVACYSYTDEAGECRYQKLRYEPKRFAYRRPLDADAGVWAWDMQNVVRLPYRLHNLVADPRQPVVVVEGEKGVEALRALGLVATCGDGGAGKWEDGWGRYFRGRRVAVLPDNDGPGRKHAALVAGCLLQWGVESLRVVALPGLPESGDVVDFLTIQAHALVNPTADDLRKSLCDAIKAAPEWVRRYPD